MLDSLGLSEHQKRERMKAIGGSDANIIMSKDQARIRKLWEEKTGKAEPEDLTNVLPVMMGQFTEDFNAAWYTKQTGDRVTARGKTLGPNIKELDAAPFLACNLDGKCREGDAIWEGKHTNAFTNMEDAIVKYVAQLHHNMLCAKRQLAVLSVFFGNLRWECQEIEMDPFYAEALLDAEERFWRAVKTDTPPYSESTKAEYNPSKMRKVSMQGSNAWAALADDYLSTQEAAKKFTEAKSGLKELVEPDVKEATGHGICIKRSKNGALTVKEQHD